MSHVTRAVADGMNLPNMDTAAGDNKLVVTGKTIATEAKAPITEAAAVEILEAGTGDMNPKMTMDLLETEAATNQAVRLTMATMKEEKGNSKIPIPATDLLPVAETEIVIKQNL